MRKIKCPHCGAENDVGSKTCDDCGRYMGGAKEAARFDPHRGRCSWESDGIRCTNAGTMAEGMLGSDTWMCSGHAGCTNAAIGHQIVLESVRADPYPDFSLDARRAASLARAEAEVPDVLRGWTVDEYRSNARKMVATIVHTHRIKG